MQISKLQRVQNAAARLTMDIHKHSHITPAPYELHWLPIAYGIKFKILILTFKSFYGLAPSYLSDLIKVKQKSSCSLHSNTVFTQVSAAALFKFLVFQMRLLFRGGAYLRASLFKKS